jgi:ATP-dependent helicase/nuclease subunit A
MAKRETRPDKGQGHDPATFPPDQAARDLIVRELDRNVLVEAAAGTGKTTSLVARIVNLIRQGKCQVGSLAAVTFTRKAAAELRGRVQVELEKAIREATGVEKERLADAVKHVERAFLGTIHSFCARMLRERPVEAGIDSEFVELDDAQDSELRRQAWSEHLERLIVAKDPVLEELALLGVEIGELRTTFERFADFPDVAEWPAPVVPVPDPESLLTALRSYVQHIRALEPALPLEYGNDKLIPQYRRLLRAVRHTDFESPAELLTVLAPFVSSSRDEASDPAVVQKQWPGGKAQAEAEKARWRAFGQNYATPYVQALRRVRYRVVLDLLRPAVQIYDRLRSAGGWLNFQDLLLAAAGLLRHSPAIREYFRKRFTHLLIDEFQDTDPIQAEVMMLLTSDDPHEGNWRRCRPKPGSMFVVGDPKQSIYRFRRADIVTYNEVKRIIVSTGGEVVALSANFRGTAPLVEWINGSFTGRFPAAATQFAPVYSSLQVGRLDERAGDLAGLYSLKATGANKEEILVNESQIVARIVRHALDSRRKVPRSAREHDQPEAAQPGDFLIVTRNTANLSRYAGALQALGVPHHVTGGTALNELEELPLLCACLRALVRPDDPVALIGVLRSELFGISDAALYEFKRAGGQFSFRQPVPSIGLSPEHDAALRDSLGRLQRYFGWLDALPAVTCIERIADDLGLLARACAAPGGDVRAGSLAKVFELCRAAVREQLSMVDLLEYLERLVTADEKYDGISVRPHGAPVVRLMNLHKVKGLEAPVVILADPTGNFEHPIDLHIDRFGESVRGYMAVYAPRPEAGFSTPRLIACPPEWARYEETERDFLQAENERLLYVAATRAGTCLVVSRREKRANENPWRSLADDLADRGILEDPGPQSAPARPQVHVREEDVKAGVKQINDRWTAVCQPTYKVEAVKAAALSRALPGSDARPVASDSGDTSLEIDSGNAAAAGERGVEWGEDMHVLLESAMRRPGADLKSLARSLTREREIVDDDDQRVTLLLEMVAKVRQSEIWKRAHASERVLAEVPLTMMTEEDEASSSLPTLQRGAIDLVFREAQGWVIVDYKTDRVDAKSVKAKVEHYRPQVESYAKAWARLVGEPVREIGLFFTYVNRYECLSSVLHD